MTIRARVPETSLASMRCKRKKYKTKQLLHLSVVLPLYPGSAVPDHPLSTERKAYNDVTLALTANRVMSKAEYVMVSRYAFR